MTHYDRAGAGGESGMYINAPRGDWSPAPTPQSVSSCVKKSVGPSQDLINATTGPRCPCSHLMPGPGAGSVMRLVIKSSRIGTLRAENQINAKFPVE